MKKRHSILLRKTIALFVVFAFSLQPSLLVFAEPSATADPNANANQQPTVTEETNHENKQVTVVDIAGPNANGLSHNKYLDFNVGPNGLILNNSLNINNAQLLNNLHINPNLQGRAASIILNEVTGPNLSYLNGPLEVGGNRASVIIANPNGIVGSGFSFINTDRITLTTGTPDLDGSGNLSFNVTSGGVSLTNAGMDPAQPLSKLDIYTRALYLNTELWADEINVVTGANKVDYNTSNVTGTVEAKGGEPALALDVSALGGMYANKIRLIGTQQGLGVNIQGEISASKNLILTNEGKIVLNSATKIEDDEEVTVGIIAAGESVHIKSSDNIIIYAEAQIISEKDITIEGKNVSNAGLILAGAVDIADEEEGETQQAAIPADLKITAQEELFNIGQLGASKDIALSGQQVVYEKQDIYSEKLIVNNQEVDLTQTPGEGTGGPSGAVDDHDNPLIPDLPQVDDTTLINKEDDEDLKQVANPNAGQNKPIVDKTQSGIDLIQIATPSAGGVSKNVFTDFNIKTSGLILNNSTQYTDTKLGGWIDKNILLGVSAKVILNEVTGGNISQLNGFLEVAGTKAAVVIANPNGIVANGFGYINVNNATLQTSNLTIQGEGLNATGTNNLTINSTNLNLNASELWGNNLNLNTSAQLTNNGRIITDGNVNITTNNLVNNANSLISSKASVAINALGTVQNNKAVITVDGNLSIDAQDINNTNNTAIFTKGNTTLDAQNKITNNDALLVSDGSTSLTAKNIENLNNSLIYAGGNITLLADQTVLNQSASIESKNNIDITADKLVNEKETFQTSWTVTTQTIAYSIRPIAGHYKAERKFVRTTQTGTILNETASAQILADKNITINTNEVINHYSIIAASENLTINTGNLENHGYQGTIINTDAGTDTHHWKKKKRSWGGLRKKWKRGTTRISYYAKEEIDTNTSRLGLLSAGDNITINADNIENKVFNAGGDEPTGRTNDKPYFPNVINQLLQDTQGTLTINSQLFKPTDDPEAKYLIETDPRFTNYKEFLSSDYLFQRVKTDPDKVAKRLGDGYYEQKLIIEQITQLTGRKYLNNYQDEMSQYKALMNNAIPFAAEFNLTIGVKLTALQMLSLTSDIVWLEEHEVNGETVLVPVVYLASLKPSDMISSGAVIVGSDVELYGQENLTNMGTIKADNGLKIDANIITNKFGNISGKDLDITAKEINNQSAIIQGENITLNADNITNETLTQTDNYGNLSKTTILDTAGIIADKDITINATDKFTNKGAVVSAGEDLNINAKQVEISSIAAERHVAAVYGKSSVKQDDVIHIGSYLEGNNVNIEANDTIKIKGSTIVAEDNITLKAENGVEITADKDYSYSDVTVGSRGSFYFERNQNEDESVSSSNIVAGKDITIESGKDILIKGSNVQSDEGKISLTAEDNVNIESETEYHQTLFEQEKKKSGFLSKKKTKIYDYNDLNAQVGSNISGNEIEINAGNDVNIKASNVVGTKDVTVNAGGDINIESQEQTSSSYYKKEVKKSGLMSGGGFGFSIGSEKMKNKLTTQNTEQVGSTVGSLEGSINLNAGQDVNIKASDLFAKEDIYIEGNSVNIESADNIYSYQEKKEYKKTGLTFSLGGTAGKLLNNVYNPIKRSSQASDDRLKWMGAIKGGYELNKALGEFSAYQKQMSFLNSEIATLKGSMNPLDWVTANRLEDAKAAKADKMFQIEISFGTSKWSVDSNGTTILSQGSKVIAEGNVNIVARDKDINIKGSTVEGKNITLQAENEVNITASQNSNTSKTDSKSSSNSIGGSVGLGSGGLTGGIGVNVSKGKGDINENSTTWTESSVTAKDNLVIQSGGDTNIKGGTAAGGTVKVEVGGDLNIETLQDTDNYHEKNKNSSLSLTVGKGIPDISAGSSKQTIDSEYKSNQEQSGIFAGDGGFDIYVEGNTDLKGSVISSQAEKDKNKLSTGTITFEDIDNHAQWEAKTDTSGVTISGGKLDPLGTIAGALPGSGGGSEDSADSTTKSAVSEGEIEIRDEANQEQDIKELSRDTSNANNPLDKIFDRDKVLERQEAAAMFGEMAFSMIGDIAQRAGWKEGSPEKIALHALVGGIMSEINDGKFGEGMTVGAVNEILMGFIDANKKKLNLSDDSIKKLSNILGQVMGGNSGGAIAESATENNYLTHEQYQLYLVLRKYYEDDPEQLRALETFMQDVSDIQDYIYINEYIQKNKTLVYDAIKRQDHSFFDLLNNRAEEQKLYNLDGTVFRPTATINFFDKGRFSEWSWHSDYKKGANAYYQAIMGPSLDILNTVKQNYDIYDISSRKAMANEYAKISERQTAYKTFLLIASDLSKDYRVKFAGWFYDNYPGNVLYPY